MEFGIFAGICLVWVTLFLIIRCKKGACPLAVVVKSVASLTFVFAGIYGALKTGLNVANMLIVFGLILAMFGDIVLDLKVAYPESKKLYLNSGMISFSLSSLLYVTSTIIIWNMLNKFLLASLGAMGVALLFATVVLLLEKPLKLDFAGYKAQIFIYSFAVSFATFLSLIVCFYVSGFALFAVGILLVLISDLLLSLMYFGGKDNSKVLCVLNHILYYIGELLIVSYLFFQLG